MLTHFGNFFVKYWRKGTVQNRFLTMAPRPCGRLLWLAEDAVVAAVAIVADGVFVFAEAQGSFLVQTELAAQITLCQGAGGQAQGHNDDQKQCN